MAVTAKEIEKIVGIVAVVLPEVAALITLVGTLIQGSDDIPEQTKEELIARIKAAQASVPEWK